MAKKVVYFNEFNVRMGDVTYFPLVSGILQAYAETSEAVRDNFTFKPFNFYLDAPEKVLAHYDEPADVAAFSIAMWNEQLSLAVAAEVKRRWPECLIVFGGAQLPHRPEEYFAEHPFIDVGVRAEGEDAFRAVLERAVDSRDFSGIPNVSFRDSETGAFVYNLETPEFERDLDEYPSPYLSGLFDYMFDAYPEMNFQAIIETNRGCPFLCTFCYWGRGGTTRKYRYHSLERVRAEADWMGRNKIGYLFNADSNFGMHKRDPEIAEYLIETKKRYGYPEKFRTCWGKNTDENIFRIASRLHEHDMGKGVTLARQTNSKTVLANIKRGNIKLSTYENLQRLFNDTGIAVYGEMILGLPGETYESWRDGIEDLLQAGPKNQVFVYQCEVYRNTELADPDYKKKFGIRTQTIELREIHGGVRSESWIPEYQDIIVETASMSVDDWRRMTLLSIMSMVMYSMRLGLFALSYMTQRYGTSYTSFIEFLCERDNSDGKGAIIGEELAAANRYIDDLLAGKGRGVEQAEYGATYWDMEEVILLRSLERLDDFYAEMFELICEFLAANGHAFDSEEIAEVLRYQRMRMPTTKPVSATEATFKFNLPEYFHHLFGTSPIDVTEDRQVLTVTPRPFDGNLERFAKEVVIWGRNSDSMLLNCAWHSVDRPWVDSTQLVQESKDVESLGLPRAANLGARDS